MKQYDGIKDEELISRFKNGESEILDYLMEKYKNMVRKKARTMFLIGGENDDLIQEGMIGLFKAVRDYQPDRDAAFQTFASICKNVRGDHYVTLVVQTPTNLNEEAKKALEALDAACGNRPAADSTAETSEKSEKTDNKKKGFREKVKEMLEE